MFVSVAPGEREQGDYDYDYYGYGDYRGGYNEPFYRYDEFYFDYAGPPQPSAVRQPPNRAQPCVGLTVVIDVAAAGRAGRPRAMRGLASGLAGARRPTRCGAAAVGASGRARGGRSRSHHQVCMALATPTNSPHHAPPYSISYHCHFTFTFASLDIPHPRSRPVALRPRLSLTREATWGIGRAGDVSRRARGVRCVVGAQGGSCGTGARWARRAAAGAAGARGGARRAARGRRTPSAMRGNPRAKPSLPGKRKLDGGNQHVGGETKRRLGAAAAAACGWGGESHQGHQGHQAHHAHQTHQAHQPHQPPS
ncbi:hypothetical protein RR46_01712 [Papilio xuthus]|uniref:Uncharacterized protein n=1 Tax=Papilio xuthus TaxID=66420 RepID=A0A194QFM4_PAPXU|nr:hypothetical protein RR46_01712 [Papilio xuthus]